MHQEQNGWSRPIRITTDTAIIFLALIVADILFAGTTDIAHLKPHPFWIPVLYITVQYGSRAGVSVAAVATVVLCVILRPERASILDLYDHYLAVLAEPVLWLLAALFLGQISDSRSEQADALNQRLEVALSERGRVAEHAVELTNRIADVERALASRIERSAAETMDALYRLQSAPAEATDAYLRKAACSLLGPCHLSLYVFDDSESSSVTASDIDCGGLNEASTRPNTTPIPMLITMLSNGRHLISLHDGDSCAADAGVLAAATMKTPDGLVRGFLCLTGIDDATMPPWIDYAVELLATTLALNLELNTAWDDVRKTSNLTIIGRAA